MFGYLKRDVRILANLLLLTVAFVFVSSAVIDATRSFSFSLCVFLSSCHGGGRKANRHRHNQGDQLLQFALSGIPALVWFCGRPSCTMAALGVSVGGGGGGGGVKTSIRIYLIIRFHT